MLFPFGKTTQKYKTITNQEENLAFSHRKTELSRKDHLTMDKCWVDLPDDLIDRVLAWLPLPSFFTFRIACKRWNHLIYSPSFYHLCSHVPSREPWFVISASESYTASSAYDPLSNKWYDFKFPSANDSGDKCNGDLGHPIAAAEGLIASCLFQDGSEYLCICNPMTKACTKPVQIPVNSDNFLAGMLVDKRSKAYRIVIAECSAHTQKTTLESSDSSSSEGSSDKELEEAERYEVRIVSYESGEPWLWKQGSNISIEGHLDSGCAMCNDIFYCVTHGAYKPNGLIAYDVRRNEWKRVAITMPRLLLYAYLIDHRGCLVMVGGLGKFSVTTKIWLWKLDSAATGWLVCGKLPAKLFKEFFSMSLPPSKYFMCSGHANLVYFCTYKNTRGLLYDLSTKVWQFLPNCPAIAKHPLVTPSGFCFQPKLDGSVTGRLEPDPSCNCSFD